MASNNFMEIWMGGGSSLNSSSFGIPGGSGGGVKIRAFRCGGVDFFLHSNSVVMMTSIIIKEETATNICHLGSAMLNLERKKDALRSKNNQQVMKFREK